MDCPLAIMELWKRSLTLYLCVHVRVRVFGISRDKGRIVNSKVFLNPLYCCRTSSSTAVNDPSDQYEDKKRTRPAAAAAMKYQGLPRDALPALPWTLSWTLPAIKRYQVISWIIHAFWLVLHVIILLKDNKDDVTIYKVLLFKLI